MEQRKPQPSAPNSQPPPGAEGSRRDAHLDGEDTAEAAVTVTNGNSSADYTATVVT